jgi:D-3-phosphoglycerate dehydrogenase
MTKVAITDYTFPDLSIEQAILQPHGCEVVSGQCKTTPELIALTKDADHVITQFAPVNAEVIAAMQKSKVIVRYGVGYDNVDLEAARAKGIPVCNIPTFCIDEVADHTLAFILSLTRHLRANCSKMVGGQWGLAVALGGMKVLRDLTVGIVGFGRIGQAVAARLAPFKCAMLVSDPLVSAAQAEAFGAKKVELPELLQASDVVSLHCPSNKETRGLINAQSIQRMKPGAILINLGRGDLVKTDDLLAALQSGQLGGAGLDVFEVEPLPAHHPLTKLDNVLTTSHIASASVNAARTLRESAANLVVMSLRGEPLPNIVNGVKV